MRSLASFGFGSVRVGLRVWPTISASDSELLELDESSESDSTAGGSRRDPETVASMGRNGWTTADEIASAAQTDCRTESASAPCCPGKEG